MEDEGRGRANVEDTPELLAYYRELEALDAGALWTVANDIEPWFPQSPVGARPLAVPRPAPALCCGAGGSSVTW